MAALSLGADNPNIASTNIKILYLSFAWHAAWRCYFESVVKHVHMDFASYHKIVAMYECINKCFMDCTFWIFNKFSP